MMRKADHLGKRFSSLLVIGDAGSTAEGHGRWLCRCDCGRESLVSATSLVAGRTKSCGCLKASCGGLHNSSTYRVWVGIIRRCNQQENPRYRCYGGRGIKVCDRWLVFENFLADMGEQPAGMQIDRINNDGDYEPSNCRWATRIHQARNKRNNRLLKIDGETITLAEAAERYGIRSGTIRKRLELGWSDDKAVSSPLLALEERGVRLRGWT